jgi:hypothetical protein
MSVIRCCDHGVGLHAWKVDSSADNCSNQRKVVNECESFKNRRSADQYYGLPSMVIWSEVKNRFHQLMQEEGRINTGEIKLEMIIRYGRKLCRNALMFYRNHYWLTFLIFKNEGRLILSPCRLCVCKFPPPINVWIPIPIIMKFDL